MNFITKFLQSRKQIWIYAIIKLSLISVIVYFAVNTDEFARKVIILAFGFIILMSMVPVLVLHHAEMKKLEKENETQNISE